MSVEYKKNGSGKCPVMHGGMTKTSQSPTEWWPKNLNLDKIGVNEVVRLESEALNEIKSNHSELLESIANDRELSQENDDKLKSILDNIVEKFTSN
mgnify:CR=1 FL=1